MRYQVLLFDIDQTLMDFKKTEYKAFEATMKDYKIEDSTSFARYKVINKKLWKDLDKGLIKQEELKYLRFKLFADELNYRGDAKLLAISFMQNLAKGTYLLKGAKELIEELAEKHKLIIITNGLREVQRSRVSKSTIGNYFEKIVVSDEVGYAKPQNEIFDIAMQGLEDIDKSKVLMIGDSLGSDILGGSNYAIDTCWFNPEKKENTTNLSPTYEIDKLLDLLKIV